MKTKTCQYCKKSRETHWYNSHHCKHCNLLRDIQYSKNDDCAENARKLITFMKNELISTKEFIKIRDKIITRTPTNLEEFKKKWDL